MYCVYSCGTPVITWRRNRCVAGLWALSTSTVSDASFLYHTTSGTASRPSTASRSALGALSKIVSPSSDTRRPRKSDCWPTRPDWRWHRSVTGSRTDGREIGRYLSGSNSYNDVMPLRCPATNDHCELLRVLSGCGYNGAGSPTCISGNS